MTTIVDALTNATDALNNAVKNVLAIYQQLQQASTASQQVVNTTINNFNARPLTISYYVDPQGGNDANDGSTFALAKKTCDSVLASLNTQGVVILLFGNDTIKARYFLSTGVSILGVQVANTPSGYAEYRRQLTFLGAATNSPSPTIGPMTSGLTFFAGNFYTSSIDILLPDVPAGTVLIPHIEATLAMNILMQFPTITVGSANAGSLFGSFNFGRISVSINPTLGQGAAGHIFYGVGAGLNPNGSWYYTSNLTSA